MKKSALIASVFLHCSATCIAQENNNSFGPDDSKKYAEETNQLIENAKNLIDTMAKIAPNKNKDILNFIADRIINLNDARAKAEALQNIISMNNLNNNSNNGISDIVANNFCPARIYKCNPIGFPHAEVAKNPLQNFTVECSYCASPNADGEGGCGNMMMFYVDCKYDGEQRTYSIRRKWRFEPGNTIVPWEYIVVNGKKRESYVGYKYSDFCTPCR